MTKFEEATQVEKIDDGLFRCEIPDGWQQGRGAFGGLTLATLYNALRASEPEEDRVLRVFNGDLPAAVKAEAAEIETTVLRRGNNLTNIDGRMHQNDEIVARASAVFSRDRDVENSGIKEHPLPDPPDWRELDRVRLPTPPAPVFTQHYDFWPSGDFLFSGANNPVVDGYVREADGEGGHTYGSIIGLLDAHWPTFLVTVTEPRATATVAFTAEFFVDPTTLDATEPLLYHAHAMAERGGFYLEFRELWHHDKLVAMNQQTFAII